jgi:hypothetical protein
MGGGEGSCFRPDDGPPSDGIEVVPENGKPKQSGEDGIHAHGHPEGMGRYATHCPRFRMEGRGRGKCPGGQVHGHVPTGPQNQAKGVSATALAAANSEPSDTSWKTASISGERYLSVPGP